MVSRYASLIAAIFEAHHTADATSFEFSREEIETTARALEIPLPKNVGDVLYSFRFRVPLPESITSTAPSGKEWAIKLAGTGVYRFELVDGLRIAPTPGLVVTKIPDATPELIAQHALGDEQALLAKVRYNRLIDIFLGVTAYSLQSHLRTTVAGLGQIEIDEVYLGLDRHGAHYLIPVQAKGGTDQIGSVQAEQDLAWAASRFPDLVVRAVAAQFMPSHVIALFELALQDAQVRIVQERHYQLVAADAISASDLEFYKRNAGLHSQSPATDEPPGV